jgi:uncharacterized protein YceH (UPF0502 family)
LKRRGLISTATGGSIRNIKYKHNFAIVFPVIPSEVALICLLILRGPQTPGELNTNSGRMYEFDSIEDVQEILDKLAGGEMPYILQLPKRPGQKEVRYAHLLSGTPEINDDDFADEPSGRPSSSVMEARLTKAEQEIAELKETVGRLMRELGVE